MDDKVLKVRMGRPDIIYGRTSHKNFPECYAEKFLSKYKLGKSPRSLHQCRGKSQLIANISEVICIHEQRRERQHCNSHHHLYIAIRLCYENKIIQLNLMEKLISEIYKCEGNLHSIFSIILPGHVIKTSCHVNTNIHTLYPGFSGKSLQNKYLHAFEFYLHHICNVTGVLDSSELLINKEFDENEMYTPLQAATMRSDPYLVKLLLRHGADPFQTPSDPETTTDPVGNIVSFLNSVFIFKNNSFKDSTRQALSDEKTKGLLCLDYISRAVESIPLAQNSHFHTETSEEKEETKKYHISSKLASCLNVDDYNGVPTLQHIIRCRIRRCLLTSSGKSLPGLIQRLPLPVSLKLYVDLQN